MAGNPRSRTPTCRRATIIRKTIALRRSVTSLIKRGAQTSSTKKALERTSRTIDDQREAWRLVKTCQVMGAWRTRTSAQKQRQSNTFGNLAVLMRVRAADI